MDGNGSWNYEVPDAVGSGCDLVVIIEYRDDDIIPGVPTLSHPLITGWELLASVTLDRNHYGDSINPVLQNDAARMSIFKSLSGSAPGVITITPAEAGTYYMSMASFAPYNAYRSQNGIFTTGGVGGVIQIQQVESGTAWVEFNTNYSVDTIGISAPANAKMAFGLWGAGETWPFTLNGSTDMSPTGFNHAYDLNWNIPSLPVNGNILSQRRILIMTAFDPVGANAITGYSRRPIVSLAVHNGGQAMPKQFSWITVEIRGHPALVKYGKLY